MPLLLTPEEVKQFTKEIGIKNKPISFWMNFLKNADYHYIRTEIGYPDADFNDIISHIDNIYEDFLKTLWKKISFKSNENHIL